jgi:hypothetical protein
MELSKFILSVTSQVILRNRDNFYKVSEQADKIIVWLVGFSIAIIALLLSNNQIIISISSRLPIYLILIYACVIAFGILYRSFLYISQLMSNKLLILFETYIELMRNIQNIDDPINPNDPIYKSELEKVIDILKGHFGYSEKQVEKLRTNKNNNKAIQKVFWICYRLSNALFLLTILTFLVGIIVFMKFYLIKICN